MPTDPPEPFSLPVVVCPSCGHGIDPHGFEPGGWCGVGIPWTTAGAATTPCRCRWSPNDIAGTYLANEAAAERTRIIGEVRLGDDGTGWWQTEDIVDMLRGR